MFHNKVKLEPPNVSDLLDVMKDEAVLPGPVDVVELVLDVLVHHHQLEHVPLHLEHNILEDYLVT